MLNQFFVLNQDNEQSLGIAARDCYFHEIPQYFYWDDENNRWQPRKRPLKTIGRIHFISIHQGERYYIRLILIHRKNIQSWSDLKSANGICYNTCREAADALGLLVNDSQYHQALTEGSKFKTGFQLRLMFAIILVYSPPAGPMGLLQGHWRELGDDLSYALVMKNSLQCPTPEQVMALTLNSIGKILNSMGSNLNDVGLRLNCHQESFLAELEAHTTKVQGLGDLANDWSISLGMLNSAQRHFYDTVYNQFFEDPSKSQLYYLDGPGGSGKTFLLNCIIDS
jgi:hypothetical protein